jgi:hypothetical protein
MRRKEHRRRLEDSAGANALGGAVQAPMSKFKALATKILAVSREELYEQQKQFDASNAARREKRHRGANDG